MSPNERLIAAFIKVKVALKAARAELTHKTGGDTAGFCMEALVELRVIADGLHACGWEGCENGGRTDPYCGMLRRFILEALDAR